MKWNTLYILLIILKLLNGTLPQSNSTVSIESLPAYAVVGPGGNATGNLLCIAHYDEDNPPHRSWISDQSVLLTFDDEVLVQGYSASLTEADSGNAYHFALKLDPLRLTDEGQYICQISVNKFIKIETVTLHINQFPTTRITMLQTEVREGQDATVASCHADLAKPSPDIWFEDSVGNKIDTGTVVMVKECDNGLTNSTLHLNRNFMREDMDQSYFCKIKHINSTQPKSLNLDKVNVLHAPSAWLRGDSVKDTVVLQEGAQLSVFCETSGYPEPSVTWTFTPAQNLEETDNDVIKSGKLPSNFMSTEGNHRIFTLKLEIADNGTQANNNGTFTCTASNGIGSDATVSFQLQVFALPTTTVPPTTPALSTTKDDNNIIPAAPEPTPAVRQAGPSAAVIAGIVAVAAFILIVTVILLLRYFMSHKGEYYTNELKTGEGRNEIPDDEDISEEELLGEKKRTEHFL